MQKLCPASIPAPQFGHFVAVTGSITDAANETCCPQLPHTPSDECTSLPHVGQRINSPPTFAPTADEDAFPWPHSTQNSAPMGITAEHRGQRVSSGFAIWMNYTIIGIRTLSTRMPQVNVDAARLTWVPHL
jgi:hypothetical protein